ncbi:MAG: type II toxin-antitoxin system RelB/DinJ family antitoxin [Actinomycetaceae bacterium]|nr:type II toxin-antitoxin system RelB/DinJ family antitoxin [Arcanobacterium sp.]MDD7686465.1 type II toxin-antitoxin system RelB/DinJ family antitoxin [Actinomycetaceae bacterium]MDY5272745.1 type II toxin-antitoxin system RelB/DinJ family antitoxin [Arcanobacterium sp.]
MSSVTVRVDESTKKAASAIAEDFGFDLSTITRAFYKQIVRERRIPLTLSYPEPNAESEESIREADAIIATGGTGRFNNAEEMFADLGI